MIRKETRLILREGRETRRRVGFMPLHLRRRRKERKRGGVTDLEFNTAGVYFTIPPHSIWIPYGMDIFHGFHMDSIWNMF